MYSIGEEDVGCDQQPTSSICEVSSGLPSELDICPASAQPVTLALVRFPAHHSGGRRAPKRNRAGNKENTSSHRNFRTQARPSRGTRWRYVMSRHPGHVAAVPGTKLSCRGLEVAKCRQNCAASGRANRASRGLKPSGMFSFLFLTIKRVRIHRRSTHNGYS